jgi:Zn-dependent protease
MNEKETELVAAAGFGPARVLTRRPLTVAVARRSYVPALIGGLFAFAIVIHDGPLDALLAAAIAGAALTLSLFVHECGHLALARRANGVTPRALLMRSTGGVSILEGRYTDARGAALFASGGPLATIAITVAYFVAGLLVPAGPVEIGFFLPAAMNVLLLAINLLPVAPMDGYMLFRAAIWASVGNRAEAERRAMRLSRYVLVCGLELSLLVLYADLQRGMMALVVVATLALQHHAVARQHSPIPRAR